jgi:CubicO group peptidase (beta-lactamase class C family)
VFVFTGPCHAATPDTPVLEQSEKSQATSARSLQLASALDAYLPVLMRAQDVPGLNIALGREGHLIWEGAYGYADAAAKSPTTSQTVFHSGSMGKVYAAVAIMQLVEQGRLKLDDPINTYLPFKVHNPLGGPEITVFHLLTHTSGLGADNAGSVLCGHSRSLAVALEEAYRRTNQLLLDGVPTWTKPAGEMRQYSNLGIATLGLIVERVNAEGLTYSAYVERRIMQPLGMQYAQYPPAQSEALIRSEIWQRMSTGYNTMGGAWIPTVPVCFEEYPAGGFVATPADHLRLFQAMLNGGEYSGVRLLKRETVEQMLTPALVGTINHYGRERPRERQGLVFWLHDWSDPWRAFHHDGGHMYGWRTMAIAWPEYDTALVVAVNRWSALANGRDDPVIDQVVTFVENWLKAEPARLPVLPKIENLAWKASYLRGLLYAESYGFTIGVPQRLSEADARRIAMTTAVGNSLEFPPVWDVEGFVSGVLDFNRLEWTGVAIRSFAQSPRMRITLAEAREIYPLIGAGPGTLASLAGLLTPPVPISAAEQH